MIIIIPNSVNTDQISDAYRKRTKAGPLPLCAAFIGNRLSTSRPRISKLQIQDDILEEKCEGSFMKERICKPHISNHRSICNNEKIQTSI